MDKYFYLQSKDSSDIHNRLADYLRWLLIDFARGLVEPLNKVKLYGLSNQNQRDESDRGEPCPPIKNNRSHNAEQNVDNYDDHVRQKHFDEAAQIFRVDWQMVDYFLGMVLLPIEPEDRHL